MAPPRSRNGRRPFLLSLFALPPRYYVAAAGLFVGLLLIGGRHEAAGGLFPGGWSYLAHFIAYGALTAVLWLAGRGRRPMRILAAVALVALVDELHQATLDFRHASAWDFAADMAGAITALTFLHLRRVLGEPSTRPESA
ncbi:VanZ family protein [Ectothiorhodospiraceae bacterium 2226]|nr:VanZ family protein [Ectothiorhodospiraceae bacterium 2226]